MEKLRVDWLPSASTPFSIKDEYRPGAEAFPPSAVGTPILKDWAWVMGQTAGFWNPDIGVMCVSLAGQVFEVIV